jgi:hypothetical protein
MRLAIRKTTKVVTLGVLLYRELALSALRLLSAWAGERREV